MLRQWPNRNFTTFQEREWGYNSMVEYMLSIFKALGSISSTTKNSPPYTSTHINPKKIPTTDVD
jgi:hypothetical protein